MHRKSDGSTPFFSILIPSYNRPEYITQCLDSILANDFSDYEVIISDDCSPRAVEIEEVVKPYLKSGNIRFFKQPRNLREPRNKNFVVEQANGKYTILIGDDDRFYPDSLWKIRTYIEENPGYDLYAMGYTVIDEDNKFYYSRYSPRALEISLDFPERVRELFIANVIPYWLFFSATFCCRTDIDKEISYSVEAGIGEDLLFLFDFINKGKRIFVIPESLFCWRKIQRDDTKVQKNQSLIYFSNVQARKNIYYHLRKRTDLRPFIADFIDSYEFRKRFLYDSMISERNATKEAVLSLQMDKEHIEEYEKYTARNSYLIPYIKRIYNFIVIFGLKGVPYLARVSFHRMRYRITAQLRYP